MPRFTIDADIAKAKTPDTGLYTDPQLFTLIKEKLFAPSWQFIGDTDSIPTPGDTQPFILLENCLDEPLVLVNDDNTHRLLSNVCTHRGNLVVDSSCRRLPHLRCRYHGRLFHLDGAFRSMPEFREVQDFPTPADDLKQLPLKQWGKWLFTSLVPTGDNTGRSPDNSGRPPGGSGSTLQVLAQNPGSGLSSPIPGASSKDPTTKHFLASWGDLIQRLHWLPLEEYRYKPHLSRDFTVRANWALYCENYLEGFHIPFVHAGLNTVIDFGNYTTELFANANLQLGIAKDGEEGFHLPKTSIDYGKKVAAYYFFVFPNLMFNFYPWGLSINIVKPLGINETKVSFLTYIADEEKYNKGAGSGLDTVELEDEEVVEAVQKGIRSRFYTHGRYSPTREQGTHHFHRLIAHHLE